MGTSRLPGFYKMRIAERLRRVAEQLEVESDELDGLGESGTLPLANADAMIENAVGVLGLPVGVGLNFLVNGEDVLIPMAVEEPSVIAAVSLAAKIARDGGGFQADADPPRMFGQVQVSHLADPAAAKAALLREKRQIRAAAGRRTSRCAWSRCARPRTAPPKCTPSCTSWWTRRTRWGRTSSTPCAKAWRR